MQDNTLETVVTLETALVQQVEKLAQQLDIPQDQVFALALAQFIAQHTLTDRRINQGDVYWAQTEHSGMAHPHVVIQADELNHSRIPTVVVCALTTNTRKLNLPGNVALEVGEANLLKPSVVEVAKVSSIAKSQLGDYIGMVTAQRIQQILAGMRFVQMSFLDNHRTL